MFAKTLNPCKSLTTVSALRHPVQHMTAPMSRWVLTFGNFRPVDFGLVPTYLPYRRKVLSTLLACYRLGRLHTYQSILPRQGLRVQIG